MGIMQEEEVCRSGPTKRPSAKGRPSKATKMSQAPSKHATPQGAALKATPAQTRPVATLKQGSGQKAQLQSALDRADTSTPACREAAGTHLAACTDHTERML